MVCSLISKTGDMVSEDEGGLGGYEDEVEQIRKS